MDQNVQNQNQELLRLLKQSMASYAAYTKASKQGTAQGEELAKLEESAKSDRAAFDQKLAEVVGDPNSPEGRTHSQNWTFYVQKAYVLGMVKENAFRYLNPEGSFAFTPKNRVFELRHQANTYINGHRILNRTVEHGVNPQSVKTLLKGLEGARDRAETEGTDPNQLQQLRATHGELDRCTKAMRARAEARRARGPVAGSTELGAKLQEAMVTEAVAEGKKTQRQRKSR